MPETPTIKVEVVEVLDAEDGEEIAFRPVKLPDFKDRADELGKALNGIAESLRDHLTELARHPAEDWDLNQVVLTFSLSLQASGGVIIAQGSATAGFQAALTWQRAAPTTG